ncbi:MAG: glycosyltransferase family 4 protein [Nitrososphaeria archaeon]
MTLKIIQVLTHSLTPFSIGLDPKYYEGDWHVRVAKEIMKRTSIYEIECWRPERTFKRIFKREGREGIKYLIFPSTYFSIGGLNFEYSLPMLKRLDEEIKHGRKILIHIHGLYTLTTYLIGFLIGKKAPIVAQSHGGFPALITFKKSRHPLRFLLLIESIPQYVAFHNIDRFFVLNSEEELYLSSVFGRDKVKIQPMGLDLDVFKPLDKKRAREKVGLEEDLQYLIFVGRLSKSKGLKYLLVGFKDALKENVNLRLILLGDGPYKDELKVMCRTLGITEYVLFLGWKLQDELPIYYNAADIFVFPSLQEAWAIAPLEALACGIPIITTPVGCIPLLIRKLKERHDYIVIIPKEDPQAIKKNILAVLNKQLPQKGSNEDLKMYSWDKIIKETCSTYEELSLRYYGA